MDITVTQEIILDTLLMADMEVMEEIMEEDIILAVTGVTEVMGVMGVMEDLQAMALEVTTTVI